MLQSVGFRFSYLALFVFLVILAGCIGGGRTGEKVESRTGALAKATANRYLTPTGHALTPIGHQVELPGMRPQALALSPDGKLLAVSGKTRTLELIEPSTGRIIQIVPLSLAKTEPKIVTNAPARLAGTNAVVHSTFTSANLGTNMTGAVISGTNVSTISVVSITNTAELSFTGLTFSPNGRRIYLSNSGGGVWAFPVDEHGWVGKPVIFTLPDAKAPGQKTEIPAGLCVSGDSKRLYVAANLGNRLHELDAATGKTLRSWNTGVAPFDVVLAADKAYVCNLGGRRPAKGDATAPAGKGTTVRVDSKRSIANEGSITVVDLISGQVKGELLVQLHPSALVVAPGEEFVVVANTGSDTLSVIDTRTDQVVEKIYARLTPTELFGAQPNALAFDANGKRLYVCNGTQNAVAVVNFEPAENASKAIGLIPVGWFPGAVQFDARRNSLYVANIKGVGVARKAKPGEKVKSNSKDFLGTVSLIRLRTLDSLEQLTQTALQNMRHERLESAKLPPRLDQPARPVPERVGEPSVFKHVIYVIKENRTYDQVLGDMSEGNGDASLSTFGEKFTPNQHKLAREFVLLDNTYCAGICSADGHQWTDSALANEYIERQITANTPRSYSGGKVEDGVDALAWASSGFIWDNVLAHGKTFRNYGEWMISTAGWSDPKRKDKIFWHDFWKDFQTGSKATRLRSRAGLQSLRAYSNTNTVGWELKVPDVMRAAEFVRELHQFERNGRFPDLVLLFLPNDHTGGTRNENPTPGAQIADNDLALGRVVEAVSRSRFWADTCLFAIEDDPQAGWDHVSGYRTTCYVASPYTKRRQTISTAYNHTSLVRTMELILGLPPMNELDATATPMSDCFTMSPDFSAFTSVTNRVPLDEMNPEPKKVADRQLRQDAIVSARLPLDEPDRCPEDVFNKILWRAMKGSQTPYPRWAVKAVEDDD